MTEAQVNIDKFKSLVYAEVVYYQNARKYTYLIGAPPAKPAMQLDPTQSVYTLFGYPYTGKICLDIGYNTEDILITLKSAVNWKDCYKNIIYTLFDYSNWFGPKALWLDFCDFYTDEDLLIYSYNPPGFKKDTGDVSFLNYYVPFG